MVYLRDDLAAAFGVDQRERIAQELLVELFSRGAQEDSFGLGTFVCSVRLFDRATVVHLIHDAGGGVAASFEPGVATGRGDFIGQCLAAADRTLLP